MKLLKNTELDNDADIYVVLGQVGTGKTSLVNSFNGKRLVLSFDDSYSTLKRDDNLQVVSEITSQELVNTEKFLQDLSVIAKDYDLVVFDNISALEDQVVYDLKKGKAGNNKNGQAAYGTVQDIMHAIASWSIKYKGTVLFTLWSDINNGFEGPAMNAKSFNKIAGYAKIVGRTYKDDAYRIALQPSLEGIAKNRINKLNMSRNEAFWEAVRVKDE